MLWGLSFWNEYFLLVSSVLLGLDISQTVKAKQADSLQHWCTPSGPERATVLVIQNVSLTVLHYFAALFFAFKIFQIFPPSTLIVFSTTIDIEIIYITLHNLLKHFFSWKFNFSSNPFYYKSYWGRQVSLHPSVNVPLRKRNTVGSAVWKRGWILILKQIAWLICHFPNSIGKRFCL